MTNGKLAQYGLRNGGLAIGYIVCVAWFFSQARFIFGEEDSFLAPVVFLTLFVLSALIEASAVLGQPILLFVQGQKTDAFTLLGFTVATMGLTLLAMMFYMSL